MSLAILLILPLPTMQAREGYAAVMILGHPDLERLPFSVVCNGFLMGGAVFTADHCVDSLSNLTIVAGGDSACDPTGWSQLRVRALTRFEDRDLARIEVDAAPRRGRARGSHVVVGFGRRPSDGVFECVEQTLPYAPEHVESCITRGGLLFDDPSLWGCIMGVRLCGGWSGAIVVGDGEPLGVISHGGGCEVDYAVFAQVPSRRSTPVDRWQLGGASTGPIPDA